MQQSQLGRKTKKTWKYADRVARRAAGRRVIACVCGVTATSDDDMEKHQRAKQHGPFAPRDVRSSEAA
jgi:hypothetical protein